MSDDTATPQAEHEEQALQATEPEGTLEPMVEDEPTATEDTPATTARLVVKRNGAETDISFPITPPAVIGRFDPAVGPVDVDLGQLQEGSYVSRKHAKIELDEGSWMLHDLGSSNGTYVLGDDFERVTVAELSNGTEFALGNARFVFYLE